MQKKKKNYLVFDLGGVVCHDVPYKFANVLFPPAFFKFLHQRENGKEIFEKFSNLAQSHMKKVSIFKNTSFFQFYNHKT